jgi:hypothetical protein
LAEDSGAGSVYSGTILINGGFAVQNAALSGGTFSLLLATGAVKNFIFFQNIAHQSETGGIIVRDSPVNCEGGAFIHNHVEGG